MYHEGNRSLQARFNSTALADRLREVEARAVLNGEDISFIGSRPFFFLSTCDADRQPLCSYKGGDPGFVKIRGDRLLLFPDYDGNGTFRSLGNILVNPRVSLFFIDFENPARTQVEGLASVSFEAGDTGLWKGARSAVRVEVTRAFSACPRYVHRMAPAGLSEHVPRAGSEPPVPDWKKKAAYQDVLPENIQP